jgi:hypothetical protein
MNCPAKIGEIGRGTHRARRNAAYAVLEKESKSARQQPKS